MRSTFKILMYLKKGSEKSNWNVPLMCRLTVDGEIKQFSCKMDVQPRLCADDVMSRVRLKEYQSTYAEQMAKYGLLRGIDGSETKHVTTSQYYRDMLTQSEIVQENITRLLEQKEQAE